LAPETSFNKKNLRLVKSKPKKQKLKPQAPHFSIKLVFFGFLQKELVKNVSFFEHGSYFEVGDSKF